MKFAALLVLAALVFRSACFAQQVDSVAASIAKSLRSAPYKNVRVSHSGNAVTLTGSVALYATREEAEGQVRRIRGLDIINNEIQVDTPAIPDRKLERNLEIAITTNIHRRIGTVPNLSDLISLHVHSGVVILEGDLPNMQLGHDVFEAVAYTKGVREIADRIKLGPNPVLISVWPPDFGTGQSMGR